MPPRAAEFAVGDRREPDLLLLAYDPLDLAIFNGGERGRRYLARGSPRPRILERRRTQQAAHMVGPERRLGALHDVTRLAGISDVSISVFRLPWKTAERCRLARRMVERNSTGGFRFAQPTLQAACRAPHCCRSCTRQAVALQMDGQSPTLRGKRQVKGGL
jgi:hypothetical protein